MIDRLNHFVLVLLLAFTAGGLLFRATHYQRIPVVNNEPYGAGDVIDLLFALVVMGLCALLLLLSMVTLLFKQYRQAARKLLVGVAATLAYFWLHSHVPALL
ncbi:hypothetical protein [Oceanobacter mangrovi]|uniref:hypothetical protein n=1 Tax=Oceanobacter mangrovi TaxID=2862510 RepID=UPI001C8ED4AA|nr:hypothetical protein [Oceanobacter mangrovi]